MNAVELVGAVVSATLGTLALVGLGVKFALLPWLREHLVQPVQETNRQITRNGHTSNPPTMLDQLHSIQTKVNDSATKGDLRAAARMWEGHINRSEDDRGNLWDAVDELRRTLGLPTTETERHDRDRRTPSDPSFDPDL